MSKNYLPDEMEFCYFKIDSGFTCVKLDGSKLVVTGPEDDIVEPSKEKWMAFWETLEEIGIEEWEDDYDKCCLADGYSWEIKIVYNNYSIDSTGMNHGPTRVIGGELVSSLDEFLMALEDLSGVEF
ncbi:MAG: hypothetical protein Q7U35_03255 [Methanobacteriaceae archaeon]|nr:hypothetical protein [Methanobacteriaceae archaeon]